MIRLALAAAAATSLIAAGAASAAPVSCKLIVDPAGDAGATTAVAGGPSDDALDIRYVDLATDGKKITGVLGLTKPAVNAATAPNGYQLLLNFEVPGFANPVYLNATSGRAGLSFNFGQDDPTLGLKTLGAATGVLDTAKSEIRITAKLSDLKAAGVNLKPGQKLTGINALSSRDFVLVITFADRANTDAKDYTVGAKSCVAVGK